MKETALISKIMNEAVLCGFRQRISHLILHVTSRCNMQCAHCFVETNTQTLELPFETIREIAATFKDLLWLDIGGGEPLLRDDIEDVVSLFDCEELSIPTNGWDVERSARKIRSIFARVKGKLIITLSLDGMEKTHDEIRCSGSFRRTIELFTALRELKGLRVKFNTVLCEKNRAEIVALMHFVRGLDPAFHSVLLLRGNSRDQSMRLPSVDAIRSLDRDIWEVQQTYGYGRRGLLSRIQKNYQRYKRDIGIETLRCGRQVIPCLAGRSHMVVWSDGRVSPCELLPPIGDLKHTTMKELLRSSELRSAVAGITGRKCYCTHDCNMIENILFNPSTYPKLLLPRKNSE